MSLIFIATSASHHISHVAFRMPFTEMEKNTSPNAVDSVGHPTTTTIEDLQKEGQNKEQRQNIEKKNE